jgi:hypothetical protein
MVKSKYCPINHQLCCIFWQIPFSYKQQRVLLAYPPTEVSHILLLSRDCLKLQLQHIKNRQEKLYSWECPEVKHTFCHNEVLTFSGGPFCIKFNIFALVVFNFSDSKSIISTFKIFLSSVLR